MANYETIQTLRELNPETFKNDQYDVTGQLEYVMRFADPDPTHLNLPENLCVKGQHIYEVGRKICRIEAG